MNKHEQIAKWNRQRRAVKKELLDLGFDYIDRWNLQQMNVDYFIEVSLIPNSGTAFVEIMHRKNITLEEPVLSKTVRLVDLVHTVGEFIYYDAI